MDIANPWYLIFGSTIPFRIRVGQGQCRIHTQIQSASAINKE